jgi:hypothetical protein
MHWNLSGATADPSLRLKNGFAQNDNALKMTPRNLASCIAGGQRTLARPSTDAFLLLLLLRTGVIAFAHLHLHAFAALHGDMTEAAVELFIR